MRTCATTCLRALYGANVEGSGSLNILRTSYVKVPLVIAANGAGVGGVEARERIRSVGARDARRRRHACAAH